MKSNDPVDARVRLEISRWPDDAPRGSVTTFCAEHEISRKTFYQLRARARTEGQAAVLEPRSRRPHTSPRRLSDAIKTQALQVRAALEESGLDYGPISVHDKMRAMKLDTVPSVAALTRIFRAAGVARAEPKKKPRSSYVRFVYPAPNACWQLDATERTLTRGRKCVIFQLQDDHSRLAVASHVARAETSEGALAVMKKGMAARGIPQKLLTDNGAALNPSRQGGVGRLVTYITAFGVQAITGKPGKPTTQGKNERFHQTLFRWLDKHPIPDSIEEMQSLVDRFDQIYNEERPHQALPGRITPQAAWDMTPVAKPPEQPRTSTVSGAAGRDVLVPVPAGSGTNGPAWRVVAVQGMVSVKGTMYAVGKQLAGVEVVAMWDEETVTIFTNTGEHLVTYPRAPKEVKYLSKTAAFEVSAELAYVSPMY